MKLPHTTALASTLALALVGGLAACSDSTQTAGQKLDQVVARSESTGADIKSDLKKGAADVKAAADSGMGTAKEVVGDATITTAVNAELVKDPSLSALKINVDTHDGNVQLKGTAPDSAARDRATQLAGSVSGVRSVDNRLMVK